MHGLELTSTDDILSRLARAVATSPADETEIVWMEIGRGEAESSGRQPLVAPTLERTVLVRIHERGRQGSHRTGSATPGELDNAVRQALGQAKLNPPPTDPRPLTPKGPDLPAAAGACDPMIRELTAEGGRWLLADPLERGERASLAWAEARVAVANSRGLGRSAEVTAVTLRVRSGRDAGAGYAAASARSLEALDAAGILARARHRRAPGEALAELPAGAGVPLVLAPEAAAGLVALVGRHALSASSFRLGTSCLRDSLGHQVFDTALSLRDDATDPAGLPFPFDYFGAEAQAVELVETGTLRTPAVDHALGQRIGRPVTPLAVSSDEAEPTHLFLLPGDGDEAALIAAADGGLWLGDLERLECFDPPALRFRALARGVRRIEGGALGAAVGDLVWEDRLPRLLARVLGVGDTPVCVARDDGALGAVSAPALALPAAERLRPAAD